MFKFLFLFISSLINYFYKPNDFIVIKDDFIENREIIEDQKGYILYYDYENYYLENQSVEVSIRFENKVISYYISENISAENIHAENIHIENIYIIEEEKNSYNNESKYYLSVYDTKGKMIKEELIDETIDPYSIKIIKYKDEIILLGNVLDINNNSNIFIYEVKTSEYYSLGDAKNEYLLDAKSDNLNLYLFLKKDKMTEGVFGNGPEHVICKVTKDYHQNKYEVTNINYISMFEGFYSLEISNNNIYIVSKDHTNNNTGKIRMFDINANYQCSFDLNSYNDLYFSQNGLIIVFCNGYEYLVDSKTLNKIGEISVLSYLRKTIENNINNVENNINNVENIDNNTNNNIYGSYTIKKLSNKFYYKESINTMYFDIIDLRCINIQEEYNHFNREYEDDENLYSFFGKCAKLKREYDKYFDMVKCGEYNFNIQYQTVGEIIFNLGYTYNIAPRLNVKEGMVYKSGYQLQFNGDCKLDGEYIYNNYPVYDEGKHTLTLEGEGIQTTIYFYISNLQIEFNDKVKMKGENVYLGSNFSIELKLNNYENYVIKEIDCEGIPYESYDFENGLLKINFKAPNSQNEETYESSLVIYNFIDIYLNAIIFEVYNNDFVYNIKKVFRYNFIYEDIEISKNGEELIYSFNINDKYSLARGLEVELVNEYGDKSFIFPLSNMNLDINKIFYDSIVEPGVYKVYYNLYYDNNGEYKKENLLVCDMKITNDVNVGELFIIKSDNKIEMLRINLSGEGGENINNVYRVKLDNQITYEVENMNIQEIIVYVVVSFGVFLFLGLLLKKIFSKKSKKEFI